MNSLYDDSVIILDDSEHELTFKENRPAALSGRNVSQNLVSKSTSGNEQTRTKPSDNEAPIPILMLGKKRARDLDSIPVIEILSDDENVTAPQHIEMCTNTSHLNKKICLNFTPTNSGKFSEKFAHLKKKKKRRKLSKKNKKNIVILSESLGRKNSDKSKQIFPSKMSDNPKVNISKINDNSKISDNPKISDKPKVSKKSSVGDGTKMNVTSKVNGKIAASSKREQQSSKIVSSSSATATNSEVEILCSRFYAHPPPHPPPTPVLPPPPPHALIPPILNEPPNLGLINFLPPPANTLEFQQYFPIANNYYQFNFPAAETQFRPKGALRPIAIDGSNVAFSHGKNRQFSCKGIKICIDYFLKRGHSTVKAFVPQFRRNSSNRENVGTEILERLASGQQYVVFTPTRKVRNKLIYPYDDRFILEYASQTGAIVVSNDNYRDLLNEKLDFRVTIENRLLMYTFADDCFLVPQDPMGKNGPMLEQFLTF